MKKYVFINKKKRKQLIVMADTILEAKDKVKRMGYSDYKFDRIVVLWK